MRRIETYAPYEPPKPGDVYEWLYDVSCRDGSVLPKGSTLEVFEPTGQTPHGEIGPDGKNWLCKASNGVTIWATLEQCLSRNLLVKIKGA